MILVIQWGYRDRGRGPFLAMLVSLALWAGFTFLMRSRATEAAALVWNRAVSVCLLVLFATLAHFCHLYLGSRSRWPIVVLYAASAAFGAAILFTDLAIPGMTRARYGWAPRVGPLGIGLFAGVTLLIVFSIIRLLRARRREVAVDKRRRLLAIAIAGFMPLAGIVADGFTDLPPLLIWANLAFCTACCVAILRYRLFPLRAAAREGLARLAVGTLIATPYVGAIVTAGVLLAERRDALWIYIFSLVAYVLVVWPAYEWGRWRLGRLFSSERYDHLHALRDLARGAEALGASSETACRLTALVKRALNATSVSLLQPLRDDPGMYLVAQDGSPCEEEAIVLGVDSPLLDWLRTRQSALTVRTLAVEPLLHNIPQSEKTALAALHASLIAPMLTAHGALTGVLVLGPKSSRAQYALDDVQFLESLGSEAGMAIENARLYRDAVRSRETLEAWLSNLPDAVAIVDDNDVVRFVNREGAERLGIGTGRRSFLHADPSERGAPHRFTETIRGREYEIASAPLVDPGGQLSSVFVLRDISERKREQAERRQLEARARLSSHLASIGEMASGIAHEINNPLTAVIGYSNLLNRTVSLPEDAAEAVRQIQKGSQRVAGIVQRLLTFARQRKPRRVAVDMNEVIRSTLALREYALRTGNIRVTMRLDPTLPQTVADGQQMQQVLLNLIVNAETAMNGLRGSGNLTVSSESEGGNLHVVVLDDGPGVPAEIQDRIFDPFFTTREVGQGTGLGLSICHGIVSEHAGRIWVQSDGLHGSAFHLQIPIVEEESAPAEPAAPAARLAVPPTRVLVVDDEPSIRDLLKAVLEPLGHVVDGVADGSAAIECVRRNPYGIIFLDVRMPSMGGLEVFTRMRQIADSIVSRVVFMTGDMAAEETRAVIQKSGAPALVKPFAPEELLQIFEQVAQPAR